MSFNEEIGRRRLFVEKISALMDGNWQIGPYEDWYGFPLTMDRRSGKIVFYIGFDIDGFCHKGHIPALTRLHLPVEDDYQAFLALTKSKDLKFTKRMKPETIAQRLNAMVPAYVKYYDIAEAKVLQMNAETELEDKMIHDVLPSGFTAEGDSNYFSSLEIDFVGNQFSRIKANSRKNDYDINLYHVSPGVARKIVDIILRSEDIERIQFR